MKTSLILVLSVLSIPAWSQAPTRGEGHEGGNGGHVVVCRNPDQSIRSIEVLDLFESRTLEVGMTFDLGAPELSYLQKTEIVLSRLAKFSPLRAERYRAHIKSFEAEARFPKGVILKLIPDDARLATPAGCELMQMVIQREPLIPGGPRYTVNGDLWELMDSNQKAAMVLHEIVYREMIEYGHQYSTSARYLTGLMTSQEFEAFTMKQFIETLQAIAVKTTDVMGATFRLVQCGRGDNCRSPADVRWRGNFEFYPSGNLARHISDAGRYTFTLNPHVTLEFENDELRLEFHDELPARLDQVFQRRGGAPAMRRLVSKHGTWESKAWGCKGAEAHFELGPRGFFKKLQGGWFFSPATRLTYSCGTALFDDDGKFIEYINGIASLSFFEGTESALIKARRFYEDENSVFLVEGVLSVNNLCFEKETGKGARCLKTVISDGSKPARFEYDSKLQNWKSDGLAWKIERGEWRHPTLEIRLETIRWDAQLGFVGMLDKDFNLGEELGIAKSGTHMSIRSERDKNFAAVSSYTPLSLLQIKTQRDGIVPCQAGVATEVELKTPVHENWHYQLVSCVLEKETRFKSPDGRTVRIKAGTRVRRNERGYFSPSNT